MSYSFNIKAISKAAAMAAVASKVDEIVATQPIHARDRPAILANANSIIDLLADDDTKDVSVSCNGYVTWNGAGTFSPESAAFGGVSIGCSAGHVARS
jgi:hypothetical protein